MVKELVTDLEQLNKRAKEWDVRANQNLSVELVQALDDTLEAHKEFVYLCSNEIGYNERAIDMRFSDDTYIFMNPLFQKSDKVVLVRETDRVNGKEYIIPRFSEIEVVYQDCLGATKANKFTDMAAFIMCQAMDTLDGIHSSDYGLEVIPEYDQATPEEQEQVLEMYIASLNDGYKKLDEELSESSEVGDAWKAAKFLKAVSDGKVELDNKPISKRKQKKLNKLVKDIEHKANKLKFWRKKNEG